MVCRILFTMWHKPLRRLKYLKVGGFMNNFAIDCIFMLLKLCVRWHRVIVLNDKL